MPVKKTPLLFQVKNSLGSLESEVMRIIWGNQKITVRDIVSNLRKRKPVAYTTVMTVMNNLFKKGFLTREKVKKSYYYSPIARENHFVIISLSKVFKDLIASYGKVKILFSAVNTSLFAFPKITIIPTSSNKVINTYKTPVGYSVSFTLVLVLLGFSAFDLLQNLSFFGAFDYLTLLTSEPSLFMDRLYLFVPAFLESLPIANILTTAISLILVVVLAKKLFKLLDFRIPQLTNLGGAI